MKKISVRSFVCVGFVVALVSLAAGCRKSSAPVAQKEDHDHGHGHQHAPPHGGTPVLVGEHKFHLELVRDGAAGLIQAYVLDDELEGYVPVAETNFTLKATFNGRTEQVEFARAVNPEDGKVPATSSVFEGRADWVKSATNFDGVIPAITLKAETFTNVTFPFPKGTKHVH